MTYKIWKPEHDGHAPPNWGEGMKWDSSKLTLFDERYSPKWRKGWNYYVEPEALNSPNDDAETPEAVETGKLENIVRGLRQYPAEELAKHGITLAPEKDWATELANVLTCTLVEDWPVLLRTRFEQMKDSRND